MVTTSELHPLLDRPVEVRNGVTGSERPQALLDALPDRPEPLLDLAHRHVVSVRQFTRESVVQLCRLAALIETKPALLHPPLPGKILISAFYEPSTRTRLSFESAWHRLGGDVISITDRATTGIAKGESLQDVAEMFSNYGDLVVLRDNAEDSVYAMLEGLRIPIINAGNGIDEHPTQALTDLFALLKWRPDLAFGAPGGRIRIAVVGTPGKMRTVRSLLLLLTLFADAIEEVVVVNPNEELFAPGQREELERGGLRVCVERQLRGVLPACDVVYINAIAWIGDTYERLTGDLQLHAGSPLKPGAIVLHPLARGEELDASLDATPHNWYFAQARGAVFIRMALLSALTQRINLLVDAPLPDLER
ncbi:MAG: hypothetical protein R2834_11375 [Rhodothermales bacterium]